MPKIVIKLFNILFKVEYGKIHKMNNIQLEQLVTANSGLKSSDEETTEGGAKSLEQTAIEIVNFCI
jgi:hypothetical protein